MIDAITPPRPATQRKCLPHAVPQVAAVGGSLGLVDHYSRRFCARRELEDIVIVVRVNSAAVTLALVRLDRVCQPDCVIDVFGAIQSQNNTELFPRKGILRTEASLGNNEEFGVGRGLDSGQVGNDRQGLSDNGRVEMPVLPQRVL